MEKLPEHCFAFLKPFIDALITRDYNVIDNLLRNNRCIIGCIADTTAINFRSVCLTISPPNLPTIEHFAISNEIGNTIKVFICYVDKTTKSYLLTETNLKS